ncbi:MAG: hypothetical protein BWY76_00807 [bacterium ADurb.Bin429]|nr:MAG: hypothetical protein BWY76_00807 [bacterium ADurb.Bin429]
MARAGFVGEFQHRAGRLVEDRAHLVGQRLARAGRVRQQQRDTGARGAGGGLLAQGILHAQRQRAGGVHLAFIQHFQRAVFIRQEVEQQVARFVAPAGEDGRIIAQPAQRHPVAQVGIRPVRAVVRRQVARAVERAPAHAQIGPHGQRILHHHAHVLDEDDFAGQLRGIAEIFVQGDFAVAHRSQVGGHRRLHRVVVVEHVPRGVIVGVALVIAQQRHIVLFRRALQVAQRHQQHRAAVHQRNEIRALVMAVADIRADIHHQRHAFRRRPAVEEHLVGHHLRQEIEPLVRAPNLFKRALPRGMAQQQHGIPVARRFGTGVIRQRIRLQQRPAAKFSGVGEAVDVFNTVHGVVV